MEHLTAETLARLVDDVPRPDETEHLEACDACSGELTALREQTEALASLPDIMPPLGDWQVLEAQLRSEGLLEDPSPFQKLALARTPGWMPAAAAIVLFLGGAGAGAALTRGGVGLALPSVPDATSVEDAATAVLVAEQGYVTAVSLYHELLARDGGSGGGGDPISRYAALEHVVSVSQAAIRQAPGDLYLNGLLASAIAERDAAARVVSASRDNWF